jgi:hypothetical protein
MAIIILSGTVTPAPITARQADRPLFGLSRRHFGDFELLTLVTVICFNREYDAFTSHFCFLNELSGNKKPT